MNLIRIQLSYRNHFLDLCDHQIGSCRHNWVEISCTFLIDQIAEMVRTGGVNQCHISPNRWFNDDRSALKLYKWLFLPDNRVDADIGQKTKKAGTASSDFLSQDPLRIELHLDLSPVHHADDGAVEAEVTRDDFFHATRLDEFRYPHTIFIGFVLDESQVGCAVS